MIAQVNGERKDVTEGTTLGELLRSLSIGNTGIAVAVNGSVIPRAGLEHYRLHDGDAVEIVRAVAGG